MADSGTHSGDERCPPKRIIALALRSSTLHASDIDQKRLRQKDTRISTRFRISKRFYLVVIDVSPYGSFISSRLVHDFPTAGNRIVQSCPHQPNEPKLRISK